MFAFEFYDLDKESCLEIAVYDSDGLIQDTLIQKNVIYVTPGQSLVYYNFNGLEIRVGDAIAPANKTIYKLHENILSMEAMLSKNKEQYNNVCGEYQNTIKILEERVETLETKLKTIQTTAFESLKLLKKIVK